jgi:hypothetical protein
MHPNRIARREPKMRKLLGALAVSALAVGLTAVPAAGKAAPKLVPSTVTVSATPTTIVPTTTSVNATGSVNATSGCQKDRVVRFAYVNSTTGVVTNLVETAVTGPNGSFSAVLPKPADAPPATVTLRATVDETLRQVGPSPKAMKKFKKAKKKGKKGKKPKPGRPFLCQSGTGSSGPLTVSN